MRLLVIILTILNLYFYMAIRAMNFSEREFLKIAREAQLDSKRECSAKQYAVLGGE
jgi:hypothetical protein